MLPVVFDLWITIILNHYVVSRVQSWLQAVSNVLKSWNAILLETAFLIQEWRIYVTSWFHLILHTDTISIEIVI